MEKVEQRTSVSELRKQHAEKKVQFETKNRGLLGLLYKRNIKWSEDKANVDGLQEKLNKASAEVIKEDVNKYLDEVEARIDAQAEAMTKNRLALSKLYDGWQKNPAVQKFKKFRSKISIPVALGATAVLALSSGPAAISLAAGYGGYRLVSRVIGAVGFSTMFYEKFKASDEQKARTEAIQLTGKRAEEMKKIRKPGKIKIFGRRISSFIINRIIMGNNITDVTSGLRAWNKRSVKLLCNIYFNKYKLTDDSVFWVFETIIASKIDLVRFPGPVVD